MTERDTLKLIGLRIRELRAERGIAQEKFANKINMARSYFTEVENGQRNISIKNLEKITEGFGIDLREFFTSDIFSE